MADYTDVVDADPSSLVDELGAPLTPEQHDLIEFGTAIPVPPVLPSIFQRIYDSGNSNYVYYTDSVVNFAPGINDTVPINSGTLDAATHEVIKEN